MLLGVRVRLIVVAAAPAPPVPAPPAGKPPLPLSSLRRRSSSGNAHGRDTTTTAATSSRATRRWWWRWSDRDGSQQDYGFSSLEVEDKYDYEDEAAFSGFGWAGELFDESWFSKVFKTYGVILPVMLTAMFAATGLKAFLMAMAIPSTQWAISFLLRRRKGNRNDTNRWRRIGAPFQDEYYPEDATDFATGGRRGKGDNTKSSSRGYGWGGNKSGGASYYGGWDELLDKNTVAAKEAKRTKSRPPERNRMRTRRRWMPRTMGLGRTRYKHAPPLMRWLVALFPFLRSLFRLL